MRLHTLPIFLLFSLTTFANPSTHFDRQGFIETYAAMAATEMQRAGIPASITLAQAILESSWGQGTVAVEGNNFFGIKCYNGWLGQCVKAMDDEIAPSDFRFYNNVEESFRDHSDFLTNNVRYRPLFDIPMTDYRKWAFGLKQCGYATDSRYAEKLIKLIEEHGLYLYDFAMQGIQFNVLNTQEEPQKEEDLPDSGIPSFRPEEFRILNTERFGPEPVETAMPAPSYQLGNEVRPQSAIQVGPGLEEAAPDSGQGKIRPMMPVPEHRMERR